MTAPFADPSQVFGDPSQMQGPPEGDPQGEPPPEEAQEQPQQGQQYDQGIDLEGCISEAIEAGCHLATAATEISAEDFLRFSQGVSHLADALDKIQPNPDPGDAQYASTLLTTAQKQEQAHLQHDAAVTTAQIRAQQQQRAAASRPTGSGSSARG